MSQGTSVVRYFVNAVQSIDSTVRDLVKEGIHRVSTHFDEWPERYVEQQAALYEDKQ